MRQTKTILTAVLMIAVSLAPLGASGADTQAIDLPAPATSGVVEGEMMRLLGIEAESGLGLKFLDDVVGQRMDAIGAPSQVVDSAKDVLGRLNAAQSPLEAFVAAAHATGVEVDPKAPTAQPLTAAIVEFYAHSGKTLDVVSLLRLQQGVAATDPAVVDGLAVVLTAMNDAAEARATGDLPTMVQATGDLLAAIEESELHFSMAASSSCDPLFDDAAHGGFGFIVVAGECPDTHASHRALSIDLGGDDTYQNNAGGATFTNRDDFFSPFVNAPSGVGAVFTQPLLRLATDETANRDGSLRKTVTNGEPIIPMLQNSTWQNETRDRDYRALLADHLERHRAVFEIPAAFSDKLAECVRICGADPGVNENAFLTTFPVAVAIDRNGNDVYTSGADTVQGAGNQGIGVLVDESGNDRYTSTGTISQGSANFGVGVLIDGSGNDLYNGGRASQGSLDGGYLLDLDGTDSYTGGPGSQGARFIPFPTGIGQSILFDAHGSDSYTVTGHGQGMANILVDAEGDETYTANSGSTLDILNGLAQGVGLLGSSGLLLDGAGSDSYIATAVGAQGYTAGGNAPGVLIDLSGDDSYSTSGEGQAVCYSVPAAVGALLFDGSGNDVYSATRGQGLSNAECGAFLVDADGSDSYTALSGNSQGATIKAGGLAALIEGGSGSDIYVAGASSQGSADGGGVALLFDADGVDQFSAGDRSQGFGTGGGAGLLLTGLESAAGVSATTANDGTSGSFDVAAQVPASHGGGDDYIAGIHSQGTALGFGLGVLFDAMGDDRYKSADINQSQGYAETRFDRVALGLLVDVDGQDNYVTRGSAQNDFCESKGEGGLFFDAFSTGVPVDDCAAALPDFLGDLLNGVLFAASRTPTDCTATDYFCDDVESDVAWTMNVGGKNQWRRGTQATPGLRVTNEPTAFSGDRYWYVGAPGPEYVTYVGNDDLFINGTRLISPAIDLTTALTPQITLRVAGSAENHYDGIYVGVRPVGGDVTELGFITGAQTYDTQQVFDATAFAGQTVQVVLIFRSDIFIESGPGYNVDDVRVAEP